MKSGDILLDKVKFIKDRGAFISFSERQLDLLFLALIHRTLVYLDRGPYSLMNRPWTD
nr:hypothetical protein [uncultured Allomuricauda sp.]